MILVDTSVWIDHLNDDQTEQVMRLRRIIINDRILILVGDLVLCEVLQGLHNDREARQVEDALRKFSFAAMVDPNLAVRAAANYRTLRGKGVTVRKTIDLLIGTFCIERGHHLLHDDRDFDPIKRYLGLQTI